MRRSPVTNADNSEQPLQDTSRADAYASEQMLPDVHASLARLLYHYGGIDASEIEVRFASPNGPLLESLTRPTVLFSLFDIWENPDLRNAGFSIVEQKDSDRAEIMLAPRRFNIKYLVSVIAGVPDDEYKILSRVLWTLFRHPVFPIDILPAPLVEKGWPMTGILVAPGEGPRPLDVWSDFGSEPHPGLIYMVTAPMDMHVSQWKPLVLSRAVRALPFTPEGARSTDPVTPSSAFPEAGEMRQPPLTDDELKAQRKQEMLARRKEAYAQGLLSFGGSLFDRPATPSATPVDRLPGYYIRAIDADESDGVALVAEAVTDQRGRFVLNGLRKGDYRLEIASPDGNFRTELALKLDDDMQLKDHRIVIDLGAAEPQQEQS
jgi:hypothetical protein